MPLEGLAANYQIGFECVGNYSYGMGIDDVSVTSEAHVNEWSTVNNVTSPLALTGLTPETQYLWQVQGNDSGTTDWSEEATFTTIDGTDITLYDSGTDAEGNTTTISSYDGQKVNVTISGRTLYKDGNWNTLCLPFDVSAAQIAIEGHPLHGATIMELNVDDKWTMDNGQWIVDNENGTYQTGFKDGTLYLYFKDASKIKAGVPYIVKWKTTGSDIENPEFKYSEIESHDPDYVESADGKVQFKGTFDPETLDGGDASNLYLGAGNKLYYPSTDRTINAFRGYFHVDLDDVAPVPGGSGVRAFVLNFGDEEATGIISTTNLTNYTNSAGAGWYAIDGRKLSGKPTKKGVYIHNGNKVVIK